MSGIEDFDAIINSLALAKELHEIGRFDIVEEWFLDELCWDGYYHNIHTVIYSVFSDSCGDFNKCEDCEIISLQDEYISRYFAYAWEYGRLHNVSYAGNPYVKQARDEANACLGVSSCSAWKLASYGRSKKTARKSKIFIYHSTGCSCNALENIAFGIIRLYAWFMDKCTELDTSQTLRGKPNMNAA